MQLLDASPPPGGLGREPGNCQMASSLASMEDENCFGKLALFRGEDRVHARDTHRRRGTTIGFGHCVSSSIYYRHRSFLPGMGLLFVFEGRKKKSLGEDAPLIRLASRMSNSPRKPLQLEQLCKSRPFTCISLSLKKRVQAPNLHTHTNCMQHSLCRCRIGARSSSIVQDSLTAWRGRQGFLQE